MSKRWFIIIKNKYLATTLAYLVWMMFFNSIDIPFMIKSSSKLSDLKEEAASLRAKNKDAAEAYDDLTTNTATLEKFARERYFMKKPNEDLFVIREKRD